MIILIDSIKNPMARFCSYQERSQWEVENKLKKLHCKDDEIPYYIAWLIEENFINEERFAKAYVRGKFRLKKWGKNKILQGLKQHRIGDNLVSIAIEEIEDQDYQEVARTLIQQKVKLLGTDYLNYQEGQKVFSYMYRKGYESDIIKPIISEYT